MLLLGFEYADRYVLLRSLVTIQPREPLYFMARSAPMTVFLIRRSHDVRRCVN